MQEYYTYNNGVRYLCKEKNHNQNTGTTYLMNTGKDADVHFLVGDVVGKKEVSKVYSFIGQFISMLKYFL